MIEEISDQPSSDNIDSPVAEVSTAPWTTVARMVGIQKKAVPFKFPPKVVAFLSFPPSINID